MKTKITQQLKEQKVKLEQSLSETTNFWMDGDFDEKTNYRIGRYIDYLNKSIDELNHVINTYNIEQNE